VFLNWLLRRIFSPNKGKQQVGGKLINEELQYLHSSLNYYNNEIGEDEMGGAYTCSIHGRVKKCLHILVRKHEGRRDNVTDLYIDGRIIFK
jgi:hypothetical protein